MITREMIEQNLDRCIKLRHTCKYRMRGISSQKLCRKPEHGKDRLYVYSAEGRKYVSQKNQKLVLDVLRRKDLEFLEQLLTNNIEVLKKMNDHYVPLDELFSVEYAESVLREMTQKIFGTAQEDFWKENALQYLVDQLYPSLQDKPTATDVRAWLEEPYEPCPYYPEQKIHCSPGGVRVRSKSELLITAEMEHCMIPFKYECPLQLEDDVVYPDFTVLRVSDWKVLYWEHLGMMDDPKYASQNIQKVFRYFSLGYRPFDNLILTYDMDGSLDMKQVGRVIKMMLT